MYYFICSSRREAVARFRMICLVYGLQSTSQTQIYPCMSFQTRKGGGGIRQCWVNIVKIQRKDFTHTTPYSVLCEKKITWDSYPNESKLKKSMGISVILKCLLLHAVPTIHAESLSSSPVRQGRHVENFWMFSFYIILQVTKSVIRIV